MSSNLWVERYRPATLAEVSHHDEVKDLLRTALETGRLPHMILHGPAGTGKTSIVLAFAREVFGPKLWRDRVLELNASDERGIGMIRDRVKTWSRMALVGNKTLVQNSDGSVAAGQTSSTTHLVPPWKIILLDEADMMTIEAQSALRRIMEDGSTHTRFFIICNYLSKIIEPITSRCVKCRFQPIPDEKQIERLAFIANTEGLQVEQSAFRTIVKISRGDLRLAINLLQSTAAGGHRTITDEAIIAAAGHPPPEVAVGLLEVCKARKGSSSVIKQIDSIVTQGWNVDIILQQLCDIVVHDRALDEGSKVVIINSISMAQKRLVEGASEYLQLMMVGQDMQSRLLAAAQ